MALVDFGKAGWAAADRSTVVAALGRRQRSGDLSSTGGFPWTQHLKSYSIFAHMNFHFNTFSKFFSKKMKLSLLNYVNADL
jgi:hypothetical protein